MNRTDSVVLAIAGVIGATVLAAVVVAAVVFGLEASALRPFMLLVGEPFAWIVVAALVVAAVGNVYLE
ncbi:hypothetical protein [Halorubrum sp. SY-15]|uniref:hypothetical protein n=1 Tax=Halorubrum sp. SY-15 TaxID=3402277 RepID=UPI003EBDCADE